MNDLEWLAIIVGLGALAFLYIRLLDGPGSGSGAGAGEEQGS